MEKSNQPPFSDEKVVSTSCKVDVIDVLLNGVAALATGSVVRLAETLQGISDLIVDGLTYVGMKRSKRLLVNLEIHVKSGLVTEEIERLIDRVKASIKEKVPLPIIFRWSWKRRPAKSNPQFNERRKV